MVALPSPCYSPFFFFLFFFFLASLIHPSDCKCEDKFPCGRLGLLEFPLSNNPGCGLLEIDCYSNPPTVKFGADGPQFEVHRRTENGFIVIDRKLEKQLQTKNCSSLRNLTLVAYNSHSISYTIPSNMTFFSCTKSPERIRDTHLVSTRYKNTSCNSSPVFYYREAPPYASPGEERSTIENCLMITMPAADHPQWGNLFGFLSAEFEVKWNLSKNCTSCLDRGRMCSEDGRCIDTESGRSKKKLILISAVSASAAFLGLCFVLSFLIYSRKKKTKATYLLSRNISSGPSSKSDLEGGRFYFGIPVFSYQELEEATENFDSSNELGDGGFGTVYYGKLRDGREVAIKRLYEHNCRRVEQFMNEINILTCLRHPNLVSLYGCTSRRSRELLLVYEYISNGTVADHLYGEIAHSSPLTWPVRMSIAIETASALAYLHGSDIIHRDVKTNNILLDNNFCVKVADFGLSRLFPDNVTHISTTPQGTPGYVDPEYHQCYQLTDKSDVYSFGVVLIELISSMPAVDLTRHRHEINLATLALNRIQRCAFDELIDSSLGYQTDAEVARMTTSVAELAFRCLQYEKDMRPSMDEVLAFLKDIQGGEDCNLENSKEGEGKRSVPGKIVTSPETDDSVLLKGNFIQSSPGTETET